MILPFVYLEFDKFDHHFSSLFKFKALQLIEICLCRCRLISHSKAQGTMKSLCAIMNKSLFHFFFVSIEERMREAAHLKPKHLKRKALELNCSPIFTPAFEFYSQCFQAQERFAMKHKINLNFSRILLYLNGVVPQSC